MFYRIASGKELLEIPENAINDPNFKITITFENNATQYLCYFSEDPNTSYLSDKNGKLYSVDSLNYLNFLSSAYSNTAYSNSVPPTLSLENGVSVTPQSIDWHFQKSNGIFDTASGHSTTSAEKTYEMHDTIALTFNIAPSSCNVTVFERSENKLLQTEIYRGDISGLSTVTVHSGTNLLFFVNASWMQSDHKNFYGELSYSFAVECTEHASFEISSDTVTAGEYLTLFLHGATDPSAVIYEIILSNGSTQSIFDADTKNELTEEQKKAIEELKSFSPQFVIYNDSLCAFLPIPRNTPAGIFAFSLSSGIASKTFSVHITERQEGAKIDLDPESSTLSNAISEEAVEETESIFASIANSSTLNGLFSVDFGHPLQDHGAVIYKFGDALSRSGTKIEAFDPPGNFFTSADGVLSSVSSVGIGKVIRVGHSAQLGRFVVIDHGMGLCTWYCHLSATDVRQGDVVSKGQIIGKAGDSPFFSDIGVLFICSIRGNVVDPALILNSKISLGS
ncbi:MAG: M23 family metallopeptidase [Ruminococcaceae bacterium]|nr:M23 family metallopeptidase [Oscillospiraceae bacterium]